MVIVSCSGKFHAFNLAEQLEKNHLLTDFYTSYSSIKNTFLSKYVKRIDKENIPTEKIHTFLPTAFGIKLSNNDFFWNNLFDQYIAHQLSKRNDYKVFIGWSGMALHSIRAAKKQGKTTIVERGSSHILYQNTILKEEYSKFGKSFSIDPRVIEKELKEYAEADIISIPSTFVKNSFLEYGIKEEKLWVNPYGVSSYFEKKEVQKPNKFIILYLGALTVQKGIVYLIDSLSFLGIPPHLYELWLIGEIHPELNHLISEKKQSNWKVFGKIPHYELAQYLSMADIGIQPSLQEGLSMVIIQMLSCGLPVIATTNTGGDEIIKSDKNGYIVPIRSPRSIAQKIQFLYDNPPVLSKMKALAEQSTKEAFTWDDYGQRYTKRITQLGQ